MVLYILLQRIVVNGVVLPKDPIVSGDTVIYRINSMIMQSFTTGQNLMAVLNANKDRFSTLIDAIKLAGLTDTLTKG